MGDQGLNDGIPAFLDLTSQHMNVSCPKPSPERLKSADQKGYPLVTSIIDEHLFDRPSRLLSGSIAACSLFCA
jgi:hypothetical protein